MPHNVLVWLVEAHRHLSSLEKYKTNAYLYNKWNVSAQSSGLHEWIVSGLFGSGYIIIKMILGKEASP